VAPQHTKDSPYGGCANYLLLASVAALYNPAVQITPPHRGRRKEEVLRKKLAVLVAMAMMLAMMMASAGTASALPGGANGQGAAHTFLIPQAQFGIANAIAHNFSGGGCRLSC
jgi:hypothetical protein